MNKRRSFLAFLALLGIVAGGTYTAVDTVGSGPSGDHVLTVHALTWWPQCSRPPSHPGAELDNIQADIDAGKPVAGYFLIAPPLSFGLADTPANEVEAGKRSADIAREGLPQDVWDRLLFVSGDTEVPSVCSPDYDIPIATVNAAMAEMAALGKCLGGISEPCVQVNYTSPGEWLSHVRPYGDNPFPANTMLWLADWDGDPSFASFNRHPFGGLTADDIILKQHSGGTLYNNVSVDLDSIDVSQAIFATPVPTPTPTATPEPRSCPVDATHADWGGDCAEWNGGAWVSPTRVFVPGPGLWFERAQGVLTSP